jgi:hypothetical protein
MLTLQDYDRLCEQIEYAVRQVAYWQRELNQLDREADELSEQLEASGIAVPVSDIVGKWRKAEHVRP